MTNLTDDIEALLESEEKAVRAREAAEDRKQELNNEDHSNASNSNNHDRYSAEREENDKRRSRKSGDHAEDAMMKDAASEASGNGSDRNRRAHTGRSPRPREPRYHVAPPVIGGRSSNSPPPAEPVLAPPRRDRDERDRPSGGDYYDGGGRPARIDEYRPGSSGRRGGRSRSPPRGDRRRGSNDAGRGYRERRPNRDGHAGGRSRHSGPPPQSMDDDTDRRTVFVQQLAARLRTKELSKFFEAAGHVVEAQIVKDRVSNRSKGVGYVEFEHEDSVEKAIALTGQKLLGIPVIVQLTEAEKNRQARTEGPTQTNGVPFHRLYVGNIHFSVNEEDLKAIFLPFGELEFVQLQKEDHTGRSKGYGFVQYHDPAEAKEALEKMNGFELAGRAIRVGLGNDKFTNESTAHILRSQGPQFTGSAFSGMGGRGSHAGGSANFDRTSGRDADKAGGASALDDSDVGGINYKHYNRESLMNKLSRQEEGEPKVQPKTTQQQPMPVQQTPESRCVLLKNMYDQNEETDPDWQTDLCTDVKEECEKQYGIVKHIGLALDNNDGEVYIKFDRVEGGRNAVRGLNGRWFGGRMARADYVIEAMYNANFPKSKNV